MSIHRTVVYERIDEERDYQNKMIHECGGEPQTQDRNPIECFLVYLDQYLERAKGTILNFGHDAESETLANIRKVAALAIACLELHGCPRRDMDDVAKRADWGGRVVEGDE